MKNEGRISAVARPGSAAVAAAMRSSRLPAAAFWLLLISAFFLLHSSFAAMMQFGPYTNYDGTLITNTTIIVRPVGDPAIDANGNAAAMNGLPLKVTLGADGLATNRLQNQNYQVTNQLGFAQIFGTKGYMFRAPQDSGPTVYSTTAPGIFITGMNYFVTLGGSGLSTNVTFNQVTNGLGYTPLAPTSTNGFVDKAITNGAATQVYAQSLTNGYVDKSITNNAATKTYAQSLTNGFVDKTITNNAATQVYAQSLTNGFVDKNITNNAATVSYAQGLTNGFVDKSITNNAATVSYAQGLTNGFVDKSITNNAATKSYAQSTTNGMSTLVFTNPAAVVYTNMLLTMADITNLNNSASGVIKTNGANLIYNFSSSGTNAILSIAETLTNGFVDPSITNGFVDKSITNNAATKAYAQSLTNGFVDKSITNNAATIAYAQSLTNGFVDKSITNNAATVGQLNLKANTNAPSLQNASVFLSMLSSNIVGLKDSDGHDNLNLTTTNATLKIQSLTSNIVIAASNSLALSSGFVGTELTIDNQGNVAIFADPNDIFGGGITFSAPSDGFINFLRAPQNAVVAGANLTYSANNTVLSVSDPMTIGNISVTNGLISTNTVLKGSVSFGPTGQSTNIISGTNYLYFVGAGTSITTNFAFIWNSTLKVYTNWVTGMILTNNSTAWLAQTNGLTLYSLSGSSPIGAYSAVNGDLPAPAAYYTGAWLDHVIPLGFLSPTNINAISNAIIVNGAFAAASNAIPNNNGFGTNTTIYNPIFGFTSVVGGTNNSKGAGAWDMILGGFGNASPNSSLGIIIVGGTNNQIVTGSFPGLFQTIVGGTGNSSYSDYSFIGGGNFNTVSNISTYAVIPGGNNNFIGYGSGSGSSQGGAIAGGEYNAILPPDSGTGQDSMILGGLSNKITSAYSTAGGRLVTINSNSVFAWSDRAVSSKTNSSVIFMATNGLSVNTNWAGTNALEVAGWIDSTAGFSVNGVPITPGGGSGTVTSVGAAVPSGFSVSGTPITTAGTITITRSGDANNGGNGQTNIGALQATGLTQLGGQVTMNALIVTNGFTNSTLTAATVLIADGNKKISSLANGTGVLTNDGNGVFGYLSPASFGGGSPLTTNGLPGQTYRLSTNGVSQELTNFDAPLGWPFTKPIIWIVGGDSIPFGLNVAHGFWYYETNCFAPAGAFALVDTNACVPGSQSTTILSRMRTEWAKYSTSNNFTVISTVWIGVNDFNANTTWLQVYTNIDECGIEAHASNSLFMATCITPSTGMASANRYSLNWFNLNLINNTNRHWDFLMRPDLALLNSQPDSTLWVDDVHPTELGHSNVAYSVDYTLRHVQGSTYNPNILQSSHWTLGYGVDPQGYAASVVGQAQYPFVDLYRPGAAALYFGPFANSDGGTADFHFNPADSTHDGSTLFMQARGITNVYFRHSVSFTNAPELMLTNAAPGNTTTPKLWFPITNNGAVFMVPGYQ